MSPFSAGSPFSSGASNTAALRARDADRVETCAVLDAAHVDGQLDDSEHARRVSSAMAATTFGELHRLLTDLQIPANLSRATVLRPARPNHRARLIAAAVTVVVAFGIGALAGSITNAVSSFSAVVGSVSSSSSGADWTSPTGIENFLGAYRHEFGDLIADEVLLFPEHASIERASADLRTTNDYLYRGDFREWGSPSSRSVDAPSVDLAELDLPQIIGTVLGAPATLGAPEALISQIRFEYDDRSSDPQPIVRIYVEDEQAQLTGHMTVAFNGEVLTLYPAD
ncbi:MAG: DUF1707 domain-containing protein [Rhodococcus sp.]|nr:DUF1707 domain-containing protein [Rhodococcus sp. (in: high G+C Gram-positive bacteria)]